MNDPAAALERDTALVDGLAQDAAECPEGASCGDHDVPIDVAVRIVDSHRAILAALPDLTLVPTGEVERLRAAAERLTQALRVANHQPHDQEGEPSEGFPVCSVCDAIQTGTATAERAGEDEMRDPLTPQWEDCKVCGGDHWTKNHPDPTAVLAEALRVNKAVIVRESWPEGWEPVPLAAILAALPDLTLVPTGEVERLRAVDAAARDFISTHPCGSDGNACPKQTALRAALDPTRGGRP